LHQAFSEGEASITDATRVQLLSRYRDRVVEFLRQGMPDRALALLFDMAEEFRPGERIALTEIARQYEAVLDGNSATTTTTETAFAEDLLQVLDDIERATLETVASVDALSGGRDERTPVPSLEELKGRAVTVSTAVDSVSLVRLDRAERRLGRGRHSFRLEPVSLSVAAGEILGVVGSNGAGKTTLLNLIAGELGPSLGSVTYDGLRPRDSNAKGNPGRGYGSAGDHWPAIRAAIAYVPAKVEGTRLRAREFMLLTASAHGMPIREIETRVDEAMQRYGLGQFADRRVDQLSTGYRLRFEIARMLLTDPSLLVLDEPLANLDEVARDTVLADLRLMASSVQRPRAIAVSSQHIRDIESISDKIVVLHDGATLFCGSRKDVASVVRDRVIKVVARHAGAANALLHRLGASKLLTGPSTITAILPAAVRVQEVLDALRTGGVEVLYFEDLSDSAQAFLLRKRIGGTHGTAVSRAREAHKP
jgi:ABC-2 type transport system ATP-binding protein